MENSILTSTKKILGLEADYTTFDLDILTHINAAFSVLAQIGVGPPVGFSIEDASAKWDDFGVPEAQLSLVRTYVFLKVRLLFDPPTVGFLLDAMNNQIKEYEVRLNTYAEVDFA